MEAGPAVTHPDRNAQLFGQWVTPALRKRSAGRRERITIALGSTTCDLQAKKVCGQHIQTRTAGADAEELSTCLLAKHQN